MSADEEKETVLPIRKGVNFMLGWGPLSFSEKETVLALQSPFPKRREGPN